MLDVFLSRVKGLFSTPKSGDIKNSSKVVISKKEVKETKKVDGKDNNRVVFSPNKTEVSIPVQVKPVVEVDNSAALAALQNAKRIEAEAKAKEAEVFQRLSSLDEKERYLIQKERSIDAQTAEIKTKLASIDDVYRKQMEKLETISSLDVEKAKQLVISSTEKRMSAWVAKKIEEARDEIKQKEEEITKEVIIDNIRHGLTDYVAEYTVSTISLPDEKIKGKIIGREGRNIRAFEKATGVKLN